MLSQANKEMEDESLSNKRKYYKETNLLQRFGFFVIIIFVLISAVVNILTCYNLNILAREIDHLDRRLIEITNTTKIETDSEQMSELPDNSTYIDEDENYFKVINRSVWGAADPTGELRRFNSPVRMVIMAHTDTQNCSDFESCKTQLNVLRLFFIQLRNFEDIGYNFLIGGDGAVYEGIGWEYIGYHTKDHNDNSIGIGFIGNYQKQDPTANQLSAAILLLNYGLENNFLDKNYVLKGQRDFWPIASPGSKIYEHIEKWDHFKKN